MKLVSWNINGIRAAAKRGFAEWLGSASPEILCLQETKAHPEQLGPEITAVPGYRSWWSAGERRGYSGVGTYAKSAPSGTAHGFGLEPRFDNEGRILVHDLDAFLLLNIYFPNGQSATSPRLQYKLDFYEATLAFCEARRREGREVVVCGDFNTAHEEIDLARPKENERSTGFLRIERDWMDRWEGHGYIDTFRRLHPNRIAYSWWDTKTRARERNIGWRIDYFYVSPGLWPRVRAADILAEVPGSDHCPVTLELD